MNKTDLHSSLLFLMTKLEEAKSNQMADKNFVAALTEVLRYFRDNGELKKAYDLQKDSLTDIANSPWAKLVIGTLTSKMWNIFSIVPTNKTLQCDIAILL